MKELDWFEWLIFTKMEIKEAGADPTERYNRIGHKRPLSKQWAQTIGLWSLKEADSIMTAVGKDHDEQRSSYDMFKARHDLYTKRQFARHMRSLDRENRDRKLYDQFDLALLCYASLQTQIWNAVKKGEASPARGDLIDFTRRHYGVLPIEAYLYHRATFDVIAENELTMDEWGKLPYEQQREYWDLGLGGKPIVIEPCPELRYADGQAAQLP